MRSRVTVVIPFYNCPYIDQALASVAGQTYPNVEVIVVDDGSAMHMDKIAPYANRIRYLTKSNGGTASALNSGIRQASGEYIAWLSSDDMFAPHKLERQIAFMAESESAASFTAYTSIDGNGRVLEPHVGLAVAGPAAFLRMLSYANPINGCTVVLRKELFDRAGLFNESLSYTQDYEMWLRLALHNVRFDYLPEALTLYRFHPEMGTIRNRPAVLREFEMVRDWYIGQMESLIAQLGG